MRAGPAKRKENGFYKEKMQALNPMSYWFFFNGVTTPSHLDLDCLNEEYRPLIYDGHFIQ